MKLFPVLIALLLAGCSGGGGSGGPVTNYQPPISGWTSQWSCDQLSAPSFTFPNDSNSCGGVHYVVEPPPPGMAVGKTITLSFTISGSGTLMASDPSDVVAGSVGDRTGHTVSLYLNERGDPFTCQGAYANYRLFAGRQTFNYPGTTTITVPLQPQYWTGCYGGTLSASDFAAMLNNLYAVGFTFGGGSFAGHGLYAQNGTLTFTLNSFTVQ